MKTVDGHEAKAEELLMQMTLEKIHEEAEKQKANAMKHIKMWAENLLDPEKRKEGCIETEHKCVLMMLYDIKEYFRLHGLSEMAVYNMLDDREDASDYLTKLSQKICHYASDSYI